MTFNSNQNFEEGLSSARQYEGGTQSSPLKLALIDSNPLINELGDDLINLGYWIQDNVATPGCNCAQTVGFLAWFFMSISLILMQLFVVMLFYS